LLVYWNTAHAYSSAQLSSTSLKLTCVSLQMQTGMEKANASQILMLPTYVVKLPTG
jgi:hypothetical protein